MTITANKRGDTWKVVEYVVNELNPDGEIENVAGNYDTKAEAINSAHISDECPAVVVEKVTRYYPFGRREDKFETVYTAGDQGALEAGGWLE